MFKVYVLQYIKINYSKDFSRFHGMEGLGGKVKLRRHTHVAISGYSDKIKRDKNNTKVVTI